MVSAIALNVMHGHVPGVEDPVPDQRYFLQWVKEPTISTVCGSSVLPAGNRQRKIFEKVCLR